MRDGCATIRGVTLVFYDGVCALCNGAVTFLVKRDRAGIFRFAPLQGELAAQVLPKYAIDPRDLDSIVVLEDWDGAGERVLTRSTAVLSAVRSLGGIWTMLARIGRSVPVALGTPSIAPLRACATAPSANTRSARFRPRNGGIR